MTDTQRIEIPTAAEAAMRAHAEATYPYEACGAIFGRADGEGRRGGSAAWWPRQTTSATTSGSPVPVGDGDVITLVPAIAGGAA